MSSFMENIILSEEEVKLANISRELYELEEFEKDSPKVELLSLDLQNNF